MRVYVAGKFEEKAEVQRVQNLLKASGHEITFDWTQHDDTGLSGEERELYLRGCAEDDVIGVFSASAIVVLTHPAMYGGMVELGLALRSGAKVLVVNRGLRDSVFFYLSAVEHFATAEEAIAALTPAVPSDV